MGNSKSVTTTIREEDHDYLKRLNIPVSAALAIGVNVIKKMTSPAILEEPTLSAEDIHLVDDLLTRKRELFRRLGEA